MAATNPLQVSSHLHASSSRQSKGQLWSCIAGSISRVRQGSAAVMEKKHINALGANRTVSLFKICFCPWLAWRPPSTGNLSNIQLQRNERSAADSSFCENKECIIQKLIVVICVALHTRNLYVPPSSIPRTISDASPPGNLSDSFLIR